MPLDLATTKKDKVGNLQFHNEADLFSCARVHVFATDAVAVWRSSIVANSTH